ncbi:TPA: hypothetical protein ND721_005084, partial [Escherichia coli]|nr:hypothetical protein [Escherichia coli]
CTNYPSQYAMVEDVLSQVPSNIGVIVTEHGYKRQISDEQIESLNEKYSNFIYFSKKDVFTPSQFILPYVDGALSVSSSIGYQAALWQIPYFGLGKSQVDVLCSNTSLMSFVNDVEKGIKIDRDNILYVLLSKVHLSHKNDLFNGKSYLNKLKDLF